MLGKLAFLGGLFVAILVGLVFTDSEILPWVVGGLGVAVGILNVTEEEVKGFLLAAIGLTLALWVIGTGQPFNPPWLTNVVLYVRVFVSHALLAVALLAFFKTAKS